jgi:hypothetical protein
MSFRRRLAVRGEVQQPEWARPANGRLLLPALLAGAWTDPQPGDREVIATLAQTPYATVAVSLVRWACEADPPVRRVGDAWFVVSKDDAWPLLARFLTRDDVERFENVAVDVLAIPEPRWEVPADQRWMAAALGHQPRHSKLIREGLADTLAVVGARARRYSHPM